MKIHNCALLLDFQALFWLYLTHALDFLNKPRFNLIGSETIIKIDLKSSTLKDETCTEKSVVVSSITRNISIVLGQIDRFVKFQLLTIIIFYYLGEIEIITFQISLKFAMINSKRFTSSVNKFRLFRLEKTTWFSQITYILIYMEKYLNFRKYFWNFRNFPFTLLNFPY